MPAVIFVHGTGVRQPAYDSTLHLIKERLANLPTWECVPCCWGESEGCRLRANGASIPSYPSVRGVSFSGGLADTDDVDASVWRVLYDNPAFELIQLPQGETARFVPGRPLLRDTVAELLADRNAVIAGLAKHVGLGEVWSAARDSIANSTPFENAVDRASEERSELLRSIARSWVATAIVLKRDSAESADDLPTGTERDSLVDAILEEWDAHERGLPRWVVEPAKRAAAFAIGTDWVQRRRGRYSEKYYREVGDVLLYMARGDGIRNYIIETVHRSKPPVVLLAHSLGAIAGFELLATGKLAGIAALITVGTQAPLLYELNVLPLFHYGDELSDTFPDWLNIFDVRDFLSYKAKGLFPENKKVKDDKEVNNRQPFPESHGAYWRNPVVWDAITSVLRGLE